MSNTRVRAIREDDSPVWFYCGPLLRDAGRVLMIAGVVLLSLWGLLAILDSFPITSSVAVQRLRYERDLAQYELARLKSSLPATARSVQK